MNYRITKHAQEQITERRLDQQLIVNTVNGCHSEIAKHTYTDKVYVVVTQYSQVVRTVRSQGDVLMACVNPQRRTIITAYVRYNGQVANDKHGVVPVIDCR